MSNWVVATATEKGASLDIGANLALALVAGALARNAQVSPRPGWYEPTNVYVITALQPGQRKTPIFKEALRPLRLLERTRAKEWDANVQAVELAQKLYERRQRELLQTAESQADPEELAARIGVKPDDPGPSPRLLAEDVTPEALAALLRDHGRICVASDEGSAFFENLAGRYNAGSTSWDLFNKAHAGMDMAVDRRGSAPVIVFEPALTIAITTQPALLRCLAAKPGAEGRGVLARPLYSLPRPVYADPPTPAASDAVVSEYGRRITNLYDDVADLRVGNDGQPAPTRLRFSPAGCVAFESWEKSLVDEIRELVDGEADGIYVGWLAKLAGHTARLAAALHAAAAWTDGSGTTVTTIDTPVVEGAVELARYYRAHAQIAFGLMVQPREQRLAIAILEWICTRPAHIVEELTVREVHRSRPNGTRARDVRDALRVLQEHGYVRLEIERSRGTGRPSERVRVHPSLVGRNPDKTDERMSSSGFVTSVSRIPLPGESGFPDWIDGRFHIGRITQSEWLERRRVHHLVTTYGRAAA
jgi:Protein of unknown function (DUF3987)